MVYMDIIAICTYSSHEQSTIVHKCGQFFNPIDISQAFIDAGIVTVKQIYETNLES